MESLARFGVFCITLIIYVIATLVVSTLYCAEEHDAIPWAAWIIGALAYAVTMTIKWTV